MSKAVKQPPFKKSAPVKKVAAKKVQPPYKAPVKKVSSLGVTLTRNTKDRFTEENERRKGILSNLSILDREFVLKDWDGVLDISPVEFDSILKILLP